MIAPKLTPPQNIQQTIQQNKNIPTQSELKWALNLEHRVNNDGYQATSQEIQTYTDIYNRLQTIQPNQATTPKAPDQQIKDSFSLGQALKTGAKVAVPVLAGFGAGSLMGMASISAANAASYFKGIALLGGVPGAIGAGASLAVEGEFNKITAGAVSGAIAGAAMGAYGTKSVQGAMVLGLVGTAAGMLGAISSDKIQNWMNK